MDRTTAVATLQSLASGPRLDVFRLLVRTGHEGMVAGEIAEHLGLGPTNLSFHLKGLSHAGLVTVVSEGRYQRYRANLPAMLDLIAYLTEECCTGQPQRCFPELNATCPLPPERVAVRARRRTTAGN